MAFKNPPDPPYTTASDRLAATAPDRMADPDFFRRMSTVYTWHRADKIRCDGKWDAYDGYQAQGLGGTITVTVADGEKFTETFDVFPSDTLIAKLALAINSGRGTVKRKCLTSACENINFAGDFVHGVCKSCAQRLGIRAFSLK